MLSINGLTAGYGAHIVIRDVSLCVPSQSIVALLGPNGAGKTTLLRAASGLLTPTRGRVMLDGQDITGLTASRVATAGVCHVPEGRGVFAGLTVRENLTLFAPKGAHRTGIDGAMDIFPELAPMLNQVAGTMSGGQQQMLALARTYVTSPKVAILDEVSIGLAPIIVDRIYDYAQRLAQRGASLLLVEQYVNKVLPISDYVYILRQGSLVFSGDGGELTEESVFDRYLGIAVEGAGAAID